MIILACLKTAAIAKMADREPWYPWAHLTGVLTGAFLLSAVAVRRWYIRAGEGEARGEAEGKEIGKRGGKNGERGNGHTSRKRSKRTREEIVKDIRGRGRRKGENGKREEGGHNIFSSCM